ncbi:MAG: hypothetical protein Q7S72_00985 [Candidatus Taylorbacteria bacterium]|nr:hypothetical protein [Candidatus Taylorbacteria bacterium]
MDSIIHADIFFFVTTIVAIVLGIIISIVLIYLAIILADIREISRIARRESEEIGQDIENIRSEVYDQLKKNSSVITSIVGIMRGFFRRRKTRLYKK